MTRLRRRFFTYTIDNKYSRGDFEILFYDFGVGSSGLSEGVARRFLGMASAARFVSQ